MTASAEVRASAHAHRDRIGRQIDERTATAEGTAYSQAYFDHMDSELTTIEGNLVTAEDAHTRKQIQISQAQKASDELASGVYDKQTSARQVLAGLYGPKHQFQLAAASGTTPQGPQTLPEQVDQTIKLLRNPEGETPAVKIGGVDVSFDVMADDLDSGVGRYRTSRVDLERLRKEGDATRLATNQAIEAYDRVFPWVASNLEGTFRLVGERELADRIRTSARRVTRRRKEEDQQQETAPADSASASPEPAEPSSEEASEPSAQAPSPASSDQ